MLIKITNSEKGIIKKIKPAIKTTFFCLLLNLLERISILTCAFSFIAKLMPIIKNIACKYMIDSCSATLPMLKTYLRNRVSVTKKTITTTKKLVP